MEFSRLIIIALLVIITQVTVAQSPLAATRTVVEKWVEARQLKAKLEADWQVEKEVISQSIDAYERELESTEAQISKVDTGQTQVVEEFEATTKEKESLNKYVDRLKEEVSRLEAKLTRLAKLLPLAVADRISPLLDRIPENPAETKLSISTRMQNLLGVINEVDKLIVGC